MQCSYKGKGYNLLISSRTIGDNPTIACHNFKPIVIIYF